MTETAHLVQQLRSVRHFKNLPEAELRTIVQTGEVQFFSAGKVVFYEGEPCAGLFVLLEGVVRLIKTGYQGEETILAEIHPVVMFNEVPALDGGPNAVTAQAVTDCRVWRVDAAGLLEMLTRYPQVSLGLLRVLAARNRMLMSHYEDLSFRSVEARLARLLLELSREGQEAINRRQHPNYTLAARIVATPEGVSRALKSLQVAGMISLDRGWLKVIDLERIRNLVFGGTGLFDAK